MNTQLTAPDLEETSCPLCGCAKGVTLVRTPDNLCDVPGLYAVSRCTDCGHRYMNPRPTPATLGLCYPQHYGPHRSVSLLRPEGKATARPPSPWYLRFLPLRYIPGLKSFYYWLTDDRGQPLPVKDFDNNPATPPNAFELGCSTGGYLARLEAAGWTVHGVEPSETASETARQNGFDVQTCVLDDAVLSPSSFDSAAAWMVIEHVFDPVQTLTQLHDLLKPGGQLLISIPNAGCWEPFIFRSAWYVWELPRHLQHFTPSKIRSVLRRAGFADVRVIHQRNLLNIIGSLGILLKRFFLTRWLGEWLLRYPDSPRMWIQLMLSPVAHLLAAIRQGGRLTVLARRPMSAPAVNQQKQDGSL